MSKELKIKGALSKDYQQIYIEDSPTNLFINEDGRIKTKSIKDDVSDGSLRISSDAKFSINSSGILELISDTHTEIALNDGANKPFRMTNGLNTVCGFSAESGAESTFQMFEAGGDSSDDYFSIVVLENGETQLKTVDGAGVVGHLTLDTDGDITLDAASGNIYCKDNGGNYTPGSDYEIATKKYVDDNAGGGGTQRWTNTSGGYKTNNNSASFYYFQHYPNYHLWSNSDSSPTTLSYTDAYAYNFCAAAAGTLTNIRVTCRAFDSGLTDPLKFYVFKGIPSNDATSVSLTLIGTTGTITPISGKQMYLSTDITSSNTFSAGDKLWVMYKKDSTSGNQDLYFAVSISGEYD
tara:strand:- start:2575 stop:3627 length:1053 start_codon:yes stop_codon:yes gene_type:complete